jgi:hypothetical protein
MTGGSEGIQISTRRENFAGGCADFLMLSEGLEIEHSDFDTEDAMLNSNYLWQLVEIVIGGVPTGREICLMCLFMSRGRILLQCSVSMNLFDPVRHQVDVWKVEVRILLLGNVYLVADILSPGVHFAPLLGMCPTLGVCFLIYLSLLYVFHSHGIGFGLRLFASSP